MKNYEWSENIENYLYTLKNAIKKYLEESPEKSFDLTKNTHNRYNIFGFDCYQDFVEHIEEIYLNEKNEIEGKTTNGQKFNIESLYQESYLPIIQAIENYIENNK